MKLRFLHQAMLVAILLCQLSVCLANERLDPNDPNRYLNAVREFADNVLKYGRDNYGPKHTPLFVDGLNIHTHEPVKWIAPNGDRWILSNLASQQNLFRTLDGLTRITGDPKYKQAAMDAIKYAFENLRSPNGLIYWGGHTAYDAGADKPCGRGIHEFKGFFPYYQLMWEVDQQATKQFIQAFWSGHILDWSNLAFDRHCYDMNKRLIEPWDYEYKGGPVFFNSNGASFHGTASDLIYAAGFLGKFTGDREPLVWASRLAYRYVETRDPNTGIAAYVFTGQLGEVPKYQELKDNGLNTTGKVFFPYFLTAGDPDIRRYCYNSCTVSPGIPYSIDTCPWIGTLLVGEMTGSGDNNLIQWSVEELTAWGRICYRKQDNSWVPMLTNGTPLEGVVIKKGDNFGPEGTVVKAVPAIPMDFWAYALAYRLTGDSFMWEMARNIALGCRFGDIGTPEGAAAGLKRYTDCFDPYALMGFLELYKTTKYNIFLRFAGQIGNNILTSRFHDGFFIPTGKYEYLKFDNPESIALLHLYAANISRHFEIPTMWPGQGFFECGYRYKDVLDDISLIYSLTDSPELPLSLQEAATNGDIGMVKSLIREGANINARENGFFNTPLHCAAMGGHKEVVELLLVNGADVKARNSYTCTPLHYAAQSSRDIVELLVAHGADINATTSLGEAPLQYAANAGQKDIVDLLTQKGAPVTNLYIASYMGDLEKEEAFLSKGADINALDGHGYAPLHYAVRNNQRRAVELLIAKGADIDLKNWEGKTSFRIAVNRGQKDIVEFLLNKGTDINTTDSTGITPLYRAAQNGQKDMVELLIEKGADLNAKRNNGQTALFAAINSRQKDIAKLLIEKGADVNLANNAGLTPLHIAAGYGQSDIAELLINKGANINAKSKSGLTPLKLAVRLGLRPGCTEVSELLRKHGAKE